VPGCILCLVSSVTFRSKNNRDQGTVED